MKIFLIHVRYWGAFVIVFIGAAIVSLGECIIRFGRWIGSRDE